MPTIECPMIGYKSLAVTPTPDCRRLRIEHEDRRLTIHAEDRTLTIPCEDRTLKIKCCE